MKKPVKKRCASGLTALLLGLSLLLSLLPAVSALEGNAWAAEIPAMLAAGPYAEGEVIAAVDPAYADGFDLATLLGLKEDLEGEDIMTVPEKKASAGEAVLTVLSRPDRTTEELLYALAGDDRVVFAEPNYIREAPEPDREEPMTAALQDAEDEGQESSDRREGIVPYDRIPDLTPLQWGHWAVHVPNFGATGSNMEGDPITVAVIDEPVDFSHPDLAPVAFTFTETQQEALGCDEHGFNATWQSGDGKLTLFEGGSHETHCAAILGGSWDGHGVSGAASNVRVMSVQNCISDGNTSLVNVLRACDFIDRANGLGADVRIASNSWGLVQSSLALDAAVRALGEEWGTVSVFAAGNDGRDLRDYEYSPATLSANPYAIVVAASTSKEEAAAFSSYGSSLADLAAPGVGILSAVKPESGIYAPWLTPDSAHFLESFEGESPRVTVVQADTEDAAAVTEDRTQTGSRALALRLDRSGKEPNGDGHVFYEIDLTFHGIEPDRELGNYLGLSFHTSGPAGFYSSQWLGIEEAPSDLPVTAELEGDFWSPCWTKVPPEAAQREGPVDLTLRLWLYARQDVDTVWFDDIGMGNERVPYQYLNGTSMACPLVAGAAAVLAAANPDLTGADLAELVKATVRQTDALRDRVISGGVLDFDAAGTASPDPAPEPARPLYDTALPLDSSTGAPFRFDAGGDRETRGPLSGLDGRLYYLPAITQVEMEPAHKPFLAFDPETKTWEPLPELPLWLDQVSAAPFDGRLAVKGTAMSVDPASGVPSHDNGGAVCVFVYNPGTEAWSQASAEGVLPGQTLFVFENRLALVGGGHAESDPETGESIVTPGVLADYDPETGASSERTLRTCFNHPQAAEKDGAVCLFNVDDYSLIRITADKEESITDALPAYRAANPGDFSSLFEQTERWGVLLPCDEGFLLVGVLSEDGAADTWLLRDGADKFEPLLRKTCDTRPFSVAAEVMNGRVYAIGSVRDEDPPRFFRANDLSALNDPIPEPAPQPGPHSGGGGGGGGTVTYAVTVTKGENGSVTADRASSPAGRTVTLTVSPDEGFMPEKLAVTDRNGKELTVTESSSGTRTFTMPASAVTVTASFAKAEEPEEASQPEGHGDTETTDVCDRFQDVSKHDWFHDPVQWAVDRGIMEGVSQDRFAPNDSCTRAMAVTILWRLAGEPESAGISPFTDVEAGSWYADAVAWAAETGAVTGTSADTFSPDTPVTREQLAAVLYRYAQARGRGFTEMRAFPLDFPDADRVSDYACEPLCWMTMHGIINGMGNGTLAPQDEATRAQITAMLMRFEASLQGDNTDPAEPL